jgi:hypothetical protein
LGGFSNDNSAIEATAKLYDAAVTATSLTGVMAVGRAGHTATLLRNGKVLIAGAEDITGTSLVSAELYAPTTGLFTPTGGLGVARAFHTATLLANGKVLVAGGDSASNTPVKSAELYDRVAGTFSSAGDLSAVRDFFVTGTRDWGLHRRDRSKQRGAIAVRGGGCRQGRRASGRP